MDNLHAATMTGAYCLCNQSLQHVIHFLSTNWFFCELHYHSTIYKTGYLAYRGSVPIRRNPNPNP